MFSIIMPAYNEEKYISEAIKSILEQSYRDIELIVVDDGSEDNTWQIISRIAKTDNRLKVFHPGKLGKNGATNYAVERVSGEWFSFFGADDIMETGILEKWAQITQLYDPCKQEIVISSRIRMFANDPKYRIYDGIEIPKNKNDVCRSGAAFLASRKIMNNLFPLPEEYPNEDGWMKLYFEYLAEKIVPCPQICINYRIHSGNSIDKRARYADFSTKLHKRAIVSRTFIDRYHDVLAPEAIEQMNRNYELEELRYHKKSFKILLYKTNVTDKMRALFLSSPILYTIKVNLSKVFLGRG